MLNIIFANIGVSKEKSFSYETASSLIGIDDIITKGVNIGKALKLKRTLGKESISDLNLSNPVLKNGKMELVVDDINIKRNILYNKLSDNNIIWDNLKEGNGLFYLTPLDENQIDKFIKILNKYSLILKN